jgi:hypothetical protein
MILQNRMIYFFLISAILVTIENLTNVTEEVSWQMLFELINSEV